MIVVIKLKQVKGTVSTVLITLIPSHWSDLPYYCITYCHSPQDIIPHCGDWVTIDYLLVRFS